MAGEPLPETIAAFDTERSFAATGGLVVTGVTGTNVGDLTIVAWNPSDGIATAGLSL
jgi:glycerate-2-kinase